MVVFRKIIVGVVVACLLLPYAPEAWAHGGGLNRDGCHRETATDGYHCHRGGGGDENEDTAWLVVGGVVLVLALYWLLERNERSASMLALQEPEPEPWNPLIPAPYLVRDQDGRAQVGAVWKIDF